MMSAADIEAPEMRPPGDRMNRQLGGTAIVQVLALLLGGLVFPLAARRWGPSRFGTYAVTYRLLALILPALCLGANVSVTRYLARSRRTDRNMTTGVVLGAVLTMAPFLGGACLVGLLAARPISVVIFGTPTDANLVRALAALVVGGAAYTISSSALQGILCIGLGNILGLFYTGLIPLTALALERSVAGVLVVTGLGWMAVSVLFAVPLLGRTSWPTIKTSGQALFSYGGRRVPGELAAFGLLSLPALLAARDGDIRHAGFVSLGISMVTLAGAVCSPFSTVLLPHVSEAFASHDDERLTRIRPLLVASNGVLFAASLLLALEIPLLLRIGFGAAYQGASIPLRLASVAIPPYGCYVTLRSVVDAFHDRAVTMRYAAIAFLAFLVMVVLLHVVGVRNNVELIAFDIGVWVLATLTIRATVSLLRSTRIRHPLPSIRT